LEVVNLCALERAVLRCRALQRFVLNRHERAIRKLLVELPPVRRVAIVGGGLFPRTALVFRRVLPESQLVLIDQSEENLTIARRFLSETSSDRTCERTHPACLSSDVDNAANRAECLRPQEFVNARFEPEMRCDSDLVVIPLAFEGNRHALYERPCASAVLVHDWIWRRHGSSAIVSWLLLKRLNLVKR
jgi:hypothetical protein